MYVYFSGECPAAIKLNGALLGIVGDNVKGCRVDLSLDVLVEVYPLGGSAPFAFILNENIKEEPPINACVTDLDGGFLIKFLCFKKNVPLKILAQQKYGDGLFTVFNENGSTISVDTPYGSIAEDLPVNALEAEIMPLTAQYSPFGSPTAVAIKICGEKSRRLYVYSLSNGAKKIFDDEVSDFKIENSDIFTTYRYKDIKKHSVIVKWEYDAQTQTLIKKSVELSYEKDVDVFSLPDKIIPYAFLEELSVGGDLTPFLCDEMKPNADKLNGYLGDFLGCMPPPAFKDGSLLGLIYRREKNYFYVKYASFSIENKKIKNLKLL